MFSHSKIILLKLNINLNFKYILLATENGTKIANILRNIKRKLNMPNTRQGTSSKDTPNKEEQET